MLCQQNIAIIGAVDFYSRINEDQIWTTKRRNRGPASEAYASASGLTNKQKEDILNIFHNKISKQNSWEIFSQKY